MSVLDYVRFHHGLADEVASYEEVSEQGQEDAALEHEQHEDEAGLVAVQVEVPGTLHAHKKRLLPTVTSV